MDILKCMEKINAIAKYMIVAFVILNVIPAVYAEDGAPGGIETALSSLCSLSQTLLGLVAMVLIILAGAIYAIGQILGAETRARAAVWATAMLTGAIIGIVIYIITPWIVGMLIPGGTLDPNDPCSFRIGAGS